MKSPVEMNSLFAKFFCYVTWFDETQHWRPCKRGLYVKSYCFFELIAWRFKNYKLKRYRIMFLVFFSMFLLPGSGEVNISSNNGKNGVDLVELMLLLLGIDKGDDVKDSVQLKMVRLM